MTPGTLTIRARDIPGFNRHTVGFENLFDEISRLSHQQENYPPYNIVKLSEDHTLIELAVAGFKQGDIDITLEKQLLTITGKQHPSEEPVTTEYIHRGISERNFVRNFSLADYIEVIGAEVEDGILTISLERKIPDSAKPKTIAIAYNK